ncbi:hypothetical protein HBN50_00940 [Halobacteriovorax sp. GB3]|uniref:hypothetical protein n=1 Tax=Halobacteriovorax sp. GB3 TaxID=2719615 RepID=UPI002360BF79|nr:hypothetical protein [Halobacteriovorax sp. GB3]MDD0851632.1 hypothetical protein [Halobacteriovorax sp. GB3]
MNRNAYLKLLLLTITFSLATNIKASFVFDEYRALTYSKEIDINLTQECPKLSPFYAVTSSYRAGNNSYLQSGKRSSASSPVFGFKHGQVVVCENTQGKKQLIIVSKKNKIVYRRVFEKHEGVDDRMEDGSIQINKLLKKTSAKTYIRFQDNKLLILDFATLVKASSGENIKRTKERVQIEQITFDNGILRKRKAPTFFIDLERAHFKSDEKNSITIGGDLITWNTKYKLYIHNFLTNQTKEMSISDDIKDYILGDNLSVNFIKRVGDTTILSGYNQQKSIYIRNGNTHTVDGILSIDSYETLFTFNRETEECVIINFDDSKAPCSVEGELLHQLGVFEKEEYDYKNERSETYYYDVYGNLIRKYNGAAKMFRSYAFSNIIQVHVQAKN